MSKDKHRGNREAKKPKSVKAPAATAGTFLAPRSPAPPKSAKPAGKTDTGAR